MRREHEAPAGRANEALMEHGAEADCKVKSPEIEPVKTSELIVALEAVLLVSVIFSVENPPVPVLVFPTPTF